MAPKILAVTIEISPADGSIKIILYRFENQVFQDEQEWFSGHLQPVTQNKQLYQRMQNPCHGTFIARPTATAGSFDNHHIILQLSKQFCLLSGDGALCGAGFVIPK